MYGDKDSKRSNDTLGKMYEKNKRNKKIPEDIIQI